MDRSRDASYGVRSASDGELLFETSTEHLGISLPTSGRFTLTFDLQMNVQRGIYLIECCAWDRIMGRKSFTGPATNVDVRDGTMFDGVVQLNARAQLAFLTLSEGGDVPRLS